AIDPQLEGPLRFLTQWPGVRSVVRPLLYSLELLRQVRRADLVHTFCAAHTAFFFGAVPAVLACRVYGKPLLLNYHDGRAEAHFRWWGPVVRWALRRADALVVPSGYLQDVFGARGFEADVVTNVVRTDQFEFSPEERVTPRMISNRLLEPLYQIQNTIRAFQIVRDRFPEAVLDIYGSGKSEQGLRSLAASLGAQGVHFRGRVSSSEMARVLAGGGVLVNSSLVDNMPHVIIEAFAAGRPIVTTPAGGIPYMVEHGRTALVVPQGDPTAMAEAVIRLVEEPAVARALTDAGLSECGKYRWEVARDGWTRIYRSLTGLPPDGLPPSGLSLAEEI
ncbi:MAG TPA: glycosyltransferase family 4 protein, partial [Longimicrobiales bacterium]|nr:glycosyltransferase family 4 protein [Longimicrobiales bacterium]